MLWPDLQAVILQIVVYPQEVPLQKPATETPWLFVNSHWKWSEPIVWVDVGVQLSMGDIKSLVRLGGLGIGDWSRTPSFGPGIVVVHRCEVTGIVNLHLFSVHVGVSELVDVAFLWQCCQTISVTLCTMKAKGRTYREGQFPIASW